MSNSVITYAVSQDAFVPDGSVVIIGYADNGPSMRLTRIPSSLDATTVFGNGQLADGIVSCYAAGAPSVFAVRINGAHAFLNIDNKLYLEAAVGGSAYNGHQVVVTNGTLKLDDIYYDASSLYDMVCDINLSALAGKHAVRATLLNNGTIPDGIYYMDHGSDEPILSDYEIYKRLRTIYFDISKYPINIVVPLCAPYDGYYKFAKQLIDLCTDKFNDGVNVLGVMPVRTDDESVLQSLYVPYDDGRFVTIVAQSLQYNNYELNGAASLAGLLASGRHDKRVYGAADIVGQGLMPDKCATFTTSIRNGVRVVAAPTLWHNGQLLDIWMSQFINRLNVGLQDQLYDVLTVGDISSSSARDAIYKIILPIASEYHISQITVDMVSITHSEVVINISFVKPGTIETINTNVGVYYR